MSADPVTGIPCSPDRLRRGAVTRASVTTSSPSIVVRAPSRHARVRWCSHTWAGRIWERTNGGQTIYKPTINVPSEL
eukprot:15351118-Alexandrium_andersonii.AAC.1